MKTSLVLGIVLLLVGGIGLAIYGTSVPYQASALTETELAEARRGIGAYFNLFQGNDPQPDVWDNYVTQYQQGRRFYSIVVEIQLSEASKNFNEGNVPAMPTIPLSYLVWYY